MASSPAAQRHTLQSANVKRKRVHRSQPNWRTCPGSFKGGPASGFEEKARLGRGRDAVGRTLKTVTNSRSFWTNGSEVACRQRGRRRRRLREPALPPSRGPGGNREEGGAESHSGGLILQPLPYRRHREAARTQPRRWDRTGVRCMR